MATNLFFKNINNYCDILTKEEELTLAKKMSEGDEQARKRFIEGNMKLVIRIASDMRLGLGEYINNAVTLQDMVQYGNIGLLTAVEKFDYKLGYKFSTYATSWIRKEINEGINNQNNAIKLPINQIQEIIKVRKAVKELKEKYDKEPTPKDIANYIGENFTEKRVLKLYSYMDMIHPTSLDATVDDSDDKKTTYMDCVAVERESVAESVNDNHRHEYLMKALEENLDERECLIIRCMLGYETGEEMTYDETSYYISQFGFINQKTGEPLTKQGIQFLYKTALATLQRVLKDKKELY